MVVIAAGLSAIPRDVLEAARTDGASEWQVFRRVTVPLLPPVLTVV
jgi:alpha-glucoside transport system permease protein